MTAEDRRRARIKRDLMAAICDLIGRNPWMDEDVEKVVEAAMADKLPHLRLVELYDDRTDDRTDD